MFFGIFSSILPYLIAAGFYIAYLLFTFIHPVFQKALTYDLFSEEKSVFVGESSSFMDQDGNYSFEDHSCDPYDQNIADRQIIDRLPFLICENLIYKSQVTNCSLFLSPELYSRPPPAG